MEINLIDYENNENKEDKERQQEIQQVHYLDRKFNYILASFWSVISATYIGLVTFIPIPMGNERIVDTLLGFLLGSVVSTIITYFFGSSSGSAAKNHLLTRKD